MSSTQQPEPEVRAPLIGEDPDEDDSMSAANEEHGLTATMPKYAQVKDDPSKSLIYRASSIQYHPKEGTDSSLVVFRGSNVAIVTDANDINDLRERKKTKHDEAGNQIKIGKKVIENTLDGFVAENFVILQDSNDAIEFCVRAAHGSDPTRHDDNYGLIRLNAHDHKKFLESLTNPNMKVHTDAFFDNMSDTRRAIFMDKVNKLLDSEFTKGKTSIDPTHYKSNDAFFTKRYTPEEAKSIHHQKFDSAVPERPKKKREVVETADPDDLFLDPDPESQVAAHEFLDFLKKPDGSFTLTVDTSNFDPTSTNIMKDDDMVEIHTDLTVSRETVSENTANKPMMTYADKQLLTSMTMTKFTADGQAIIVILGKNPKLITKDLPNGKFKCNVVIPSEHKQKKQRTDPSSFVPDDMNDEPLPPTHSVRNMIVS